jgi:DNA ligase-associated metallophosphoesterase
MIVNVRSENFILDPSRVLIWPRQKLLIVADIHLGKAQTFLKNGLWLPPEAHISDLSQLTAVTEKHDIQHVLFLGDFIHSKEGVTDDIIDDFLNWKKTFRGDVSVIIGNHDRPVVSKWPKAWDFINLIEIIRIEDFIFQHEPPLNVQKNEFVWCGHIHPKIKITRGADALNLPAFVIESQVGYLPAFSSLAAGMHFKGKKGSRYFVITSGKVSEIN